MKIVISGNITISLSKFVSYMKDSVGLDYDALIKAKNDMLLFIHNYINKEVDNNGAYTSRSSSCWWADGRSGKAWIFDYVILPRQELVLVYKMRFDNASKLIENTECIRNTRLLMEKITSKHRIKKDSDNKTSNDTNYLFKVVSRNTNITLDGGGVLKSLVGLSAGRGIFHIAKDDGCYVIFIEDSETHECKLYQSSYIFPELFAELKKTPPIVIQG